MREYLGFLPASRHEEAPIVNPGLEPEITDNDLALNEFMPDADNAAYDMHDLLLNICDDGDFHELAAQTAPNVITGFSRVDGRSVGVVANQPQFLSGALDQVGADNAARFVRICNAYEIPLAFVIDTPTARIAVMGAEAAISLLCHRELEAARRGTGRDGAATRRRLQRERRDTVFGRRARLHRRGDRTPPPGSRSGGR